MGPLPVIIFNPGFQPTTLAEIHGRIEGIIVGMVIVAFGDYPPCQDLPLQPPPIDRISVWAALDLTQAAPAISRPLGGLQI